MPSESTPLLPAGGPDHAQGFESFQFHTCRLGYIVVVIVLAASPEFLREELPSRAAGIRIMIAIGLLASHKTYFAATTFHRVAFIALPLLHWYYPTSAGDIVVYAACGIFILPFAFALSISVFSLGVRYRNDLDIINYINDMKQDCRRLLRSPPAHVRRSSVIRHLHPRSSRSLTGVGTDFSSHAAVDGTQALLIDQEHWHSDLPLLRRTQWLRRTSQPQLEVLVHHLVNGAPCCARLSLSPRADASIIAQDLKGSEFVCIGSAYNLGTTAPIPFDGSATAALKPSKRTQVFGRRRKWCSLQ
ncbi:hypothetical protein GGX14DRAFT_402242 [Mycena pura]|uniref:Uncharacterized protein n=1 Tax=Mycena pura TaxID=153505 RepID=A0AAD6V273_9AGAR|nr:hypothetical protein GGX14DRAFT_402242 [Mycena pura]